MKEILELQLDVLLGEGLVAMGGQETLAGGEDGSLAVALDAAAFEYEAFVVLQCCVERPLVVQLKVDGIVLLPVEFLSPAIELEVEQMDGDDETVVLVLGNQRDGAMVASPCVVAVDFIELDAAHLSVGKSLCEHLPCAFYDGGDHKQTFKTGDGLCQLQIRVGDLPQVGFPVCVSMGPGEHDAALWFPFCGKHEVVGGCGVTHRLNIKLIECKSNKKTTEMSICRPIILCLPLIFVACSIKKY